MRCVSSNTHRNSSSWLCRRKMFSVWRRNHSRVNAWWCTFSPGLYQVTGLRPVDTNWNNRGFAVQQYEMRVKRLDIEFDQRLQKIFEAAAGRGCWKGT